MFVSNKLQHKQPYHQLVTFAFCSRELQAYDTYEERSLPQPFSSCHLGVDLVHLYLHTVEVWSFAYSCLLCYHSLMFTSFSGPLSMPLSCVHCSIILLIHLQFSLNSLGDANIFMYKYVCSMCVDVAPQTSKQLALFAACFIVIDFGGALRFCCSANFCYRMRLNYCLCA